MKIVLETPRLVLREFPQDDADALARVVSDPQTMRYYPAPYDRAGVEDGSRATCADTNRTVTGSGRST